MKLCDWSTENNGNDEKILKPVVFYLSKQSNEKIFEFDNLMSELLYNLDSKKLFNICKKIDKSTGSDSFLYSRCVALINGENYYTKVKLGMEISLWTMEFESILYVPQEAWAMKNNLDSIEYPHITEFSYETFSNKSMWK